MVEEIDLLLETSVLIDLFRGETRARQWAEQNQTSRIAIPILVWMEVMCGARDKQGQEKIRKELRKYPIVYLDKQDQQQAQAWLLEYRLQQDIGPFDCLIAATAVRIGKPLCTLDNDFLVIPALKVVSP